MEQYLNLISDTYTSIPKVTVDGVFGPATRDAVVAYKDVFGLGNQGIVSASTWDSITETYRDLSEGARTSMGQFHGYNIG